MEKSEPSPLKLDLPLDFIRNVTVSFPDGQTWLERLPTLLEETARDWELQLGEPFLLSYNYVCAVTLKDGKPAVLKAGTPNPELTSEMNALRFYAGKSACRMLKSDPEKGLLLLERLTPGNMLADLEDDDQATEIAAEVMKAIHHPASDPEGFLSLREWFDKLPEVRRLFNGSSGPWPESSFATAEALISELFADESPQVLLHGDFHHFNILRSGAGWKVIDPKGVIGPAEYEVAPFLLNPFTVVLTESQALQRTKRRIAIFSERLGFDRQRLRAWAICHSVLSAFWDMSEDGSGGESTRAWTEVYLKL
jgi:streptomycin 6-kinase